ncbi:MAG TPA: glycosyltransferase family 2 protein [Solirubrobacterales bacterium]|nr:glycosyltransferase family 2 protein [Solirubrobacterales bacterium]
MTTGGHPDRTRPDLSIVVVTHNGRDKALATLHSARAAQGWVDADWLVVDAGSEDGTPEAIESEFPEATVFRRPNRGFAASNNVALREARGRYVLLLNPDVEIREGSLGALVAAMDAQPRIGLASVVQTDPRGRRLPSIRRFPSPVRSFGEALFSAYWPLGRRFQEPVGGTARYTRAGTADWLVGAFLIARREAVEEVGPLDERFFLYSEEIDWCYRFWQAGWPVQHLPNLTIVHHCGDGSGGSLKPQLTHSRLLFAEKHYSRSTVAAIRAALVLRHTIRAAGAAGLGVVSPRYRSRAHNEWRAAKVALGIAPPPIVTAPGSAVIASTHS